VLKDAHGGGWKEVYICRTPEELIESYNQSGLLTMVVQEFIEWDHFVRCVALGQRDVLPMKYDPRERRYHVEHDHLSPELGERVVNDSLTLMRALGYDMCSLEWAVKDGVPYAIDFMNPAPDMDVNSLTPHYFEWVVNGMADLVVRLAHEAPATPDLRRGEYLLGRREGEPTTGSATSRARVPGTGYPVPVPAPAAPGPPASLGSAFGQALDDAFGGAPAAGPADVAPAKAKERRKSATPRRKKDKDGPAPSGQAG
jgi:hypothetical protein